MLKRILARLTKPVVARDSSKGTTLKLEIYCSNEDTVKTISNLLAAISRNCGVGHSATVAAFFDGDGADFMEVKGLPPNDGAAMADACGDWGDGLFAMIGPHSAIAYNTVYKTVDGKDEQLLRQTKCWPKQKE